MLPGLLKILGRAVAIIFSVHEARQMLKAGASLQIWKKPGDRSVAAGREEQQEGGREAGRGRGAGRGEEAEEAAEPGTCRVPRFRRELCT